MKLEVGMYVRTKDGIIDKVIIDYNGHCANPNCECKHISCAKNYYDEDKIVKANYYIIDILEVGDYVNSEKIDYISISKDGKKRPLIRDNIYLFDKYKSINSIVTKEQFKQMAYKVGE